MITMQISIYPLGEQDLAGKLNIFWDFLRNEKINFKVTALSTIAWAENDDELYDAVFKAYKEVRKTAKAVMVSTITTGNENEIKQLLNYFQ
jgi:uncharacterized protein YqgV (UPF0045/DUF77 family)